MNFGTLARVDGFSSMPPMRPLHMQKAASQFWPPIGSARESAWSGFVYNWNIPDGVVVFMSYMLLFSYLSLSTQSSAYRWWKVILDLIVCCHRDYDDSRISSMWNDIWRFELCISVLFGIWGNMCGFMLPIGDAFLQFWKKYVIVRYDM